MFKMFLGLLLNLIVGKLKDFVIAVVTELASTDLSNEEKRRIAFERIREKLRIVGKDLRDSLINLVIELAVQLIKDK